MFYKLLHYGNDYIEKLSVDEDKIRNYVLVIDYSIREEVNLREEFDILEVGKKFHSLNNIRRNDKNPVNQMPDDIFNRDFKIDE